MSIRKILVVGSLNTDLVANVDHFPVAGETITGQKFSVHCGGKGANQAYAASALGGKVAMIGQVGTDDFGSAQIANLSSIGVTTADILRDPTKETGTAFIGVESSGENRIIIIPGANDSLSPIQLQEKDQLFQQASLLLLQLETPLETVTTAIKLGRKHDMTIILDPAPAVPLPDEWLQSIDYLTPNLSELNLISGDSLTETASIDAIATSARKLCSRGGLQVIAKLGSRGAVLVTSRESTYFPAPKVQAKDTTAAGDCFNAAFAVALSHEKSTKEAIRFAIAAASLSVTKLGAQSSLPTQQDLDALN